MSDKKTTGNKWETLQEDKAAASQQQSVSEPLFELDKEQIDADIGGEVNAETSVEPLDATGLRQELQQTQVALQEAQQQQAYLQAEMQNTVRRYKRELENSHKFGAKDLILSLLPVVDSLEQALLLTDQQDVEAMKPMKEGISLTLKLLLDTLSKHGLIQDDPLGKVFDPQHHEAMSMQEDPQAAPNTILAVFQKGYRLSERVIRPARVIVAKGQSTKVDENA